MKRVDLHTHTTASDGSCSPRELVALAKEKDLVALAVTDHDTIDGVEEAQEAGRRYGIEVIPGIEISTLYSGEMHLLGYYLELERDWLHESLDRLKEYRQERNARILSRLRELGMDISYDELWQAAGGGVIGRPHFARVIAEKGYADSIGDAFRSFLIPGKPAYFPKEKLTPQEGINLVRKAGGIPVLAHPKHLGLSQRAMDDLVSELKGVGLAGIEAIYTDHTQQDVDFFSELAKKYRLLITGGSDFHGSNKPETELGSGRGNLFINDGYVKALQGARNV
ncbi:MAG: PHP domain-containing protein [Clostridia bacterium]|jgi:predicted metal-dependent phosphoesterase TrpH